MILRVGAFLYRVHFVEGGLSHEGERCLGLCDNETHDIYVDATMSFAQQVQVICHEYMEAWLYHFGRPGQSRGQDTADADKEAWCDLFGMAMTQFVIDLLGQLDRLHVDPRPHRAPDTPRAALAPRHEREPGHRGAASTISADRAQRERIATKLAQAVHRVGLRVREPPAGRAAADRRHWW